ncbi:FGGY family carbohydrate kinase, partial [Pseudomonas viridiflava]|uniref:FGGY family carbohydrate kinase n=1 Tax=Pseudomonas viridiflava TaxID=33069 RepID=UPI001F14A110
MYLGIDCGTQGTKALVLDASSGQVLGAGGAPHRLISGPNGHREQQPHDWLNAFEQVTRMALTEAGISGEAIAGIGVSGQQHGLVLLDAQGQVLRPAKLWCDTESAAENQQLLDFLGGE